MNYRFFLPALLAMTAFLPLSGAVLLSFEDNAPTVELALSPETTPETTLEISDEFATDGEKSLRLRSPRWVAGLTATPAFSIKGDFGSFDDYDRLVFDLANPTPYLAEFGIHIGSASEKRDGGPYFNVKLFPMQIKRVVLPLAELHARYGARPLAQFYLYSMRRAHDMEVYFDNFQLLRPGEELAPYTVEARNQLRKMMTPWKEIISTAFYRSKVPVHSSAISERYKQLLLAEFDRAHADCLYALDQLLKANYHGNDDPAIWREFLNSRQNLQRVASKIKFKSDNDRLYRDDPDLLLGLAGGADKFAPRLMPFQLTSADHYRLRLARNESEAMQVVLLPLSEAANIEVTVSTPRRADGISFPEGNLTASLVGFVETRQFAPFDAPVVGWYPDPILDFTSQAQIPVNDLQSFWIRLKAPEDQAPGLYHAEVQIAVNGAPWRTVPLEIEVLPFTLPRHSPLPAIMSFGFDKVAQNPQLQERWSYFLDDYLIGMDDLYIKQAPNFAIIERQHRENRLVAFNFGNIPGDALNESTRKIDIPKLLARFQPIYERAKELGVLDHAYIYGFDEVWVEDFANLEECAAALRQAFPEVLIMTTAWDYSLGTDSVIRSVNAWVPKTERYYSDRPAVGRSRAQGNLVWYYICNFPIAPSINWFIEQPAVNARILLGAMSEKFRPDGFLYYAIRIWWDNQPITSGPYTAWHPDSWYNHHGDGLLAYIGPEDQPLPSIRLENYRDGLEDFASLCILNEQIRLCEAQSSRTPAEEAWLATAKEAVKVPEALVRELADFTPDSSLVQSYRERVIDAIVASPIQNVTPWGANFGVRGFSVPQP